MKRFSKLRIFMPLIAASLLYNCGGSDDSVFTPPVDTPVSTPELIVTEAGTGDKREITVNSDKLTTPVLVKFATTTKSMYRLYITSNVNGLGAEPFTFKNDDVDVDSKKDGSIDLQGDTKKSFEYLINFPTPTEENSTIVYTLWTTTGRGDFRDASKRNAIPVGEGEAATVGTITIKKGTGGTDSGANVREIKDIIVLAAPLESGASKTFVSLYNGQTYEINTGEETAALWDFGYYYGATGKASLSSTYDYPSNIIDVPGKSGVAKENLNKIYFKSSDLVYDNVSLDSDLKDIAKPSEQRINQLQVGNVVEFVDQYNNKGIIKVTELNTGAGTSGFMKIDVKVMN